MRRDSGRLVAALIVAGLATGTLYSSWRTAEAAELANLVAIGSSNLKRLVLSSMAAKRLGIETGTVREEEVRHWLMVNSEVEAMLGEREYALALPDIETTASTSPAEDSPGPVRVKVPGRKSQEAVGKVIGGVSLVGSRNDGDEMIATEDETAEGGKAAIVFPLDGQYGKARFRAKMMSPGPDDGDGTYFGVNDSGSGLHPGQRVIVRITQPGDRLQKVVPYSAVIYDLQGNSWVYVNPEPLTFVRHPVIVEQVDGNVAILSDGPDSGARIVTVGAGGLLGIERELGR